MGEGRGWRGVAVQIVESILKLMGVLYGTNGRHQRPARDKQEAANDVSQPDLPGPKEGAVCDSPDGLHDLKSYISCNYSFSIEVHA